MQGYVICFFFCMKFNYKMSHSQRCLYLSECKWWLYLFMTLFVLLFATLVHTHTHSQCISLHFQWICIISPFIVHVIFLLKVSFLQYAMTLNILKRVFLFSIKDIFELNTSTNLYPVKQSRGWIIGANSPTIYFHIILNIYKLG